MNDMHKALFALLFFVAPAFAQAKTVDGASLPETLYAAGEFPVGLALDATRVYWTDDITGEVVQRQPIERTGAVTDAAQVHRERAKPGRGERARERAVLPGSLAATAG